MTYDFTYTLYDRFLVSVMFIALMNLHMLIFGSDSILFSFSGESTIAGTPYTLKKMPASPKVMHPFLCG